MWQLALLQVVLAHIIKALYFLGVLVFIGTDYQQLKFNSIELKIL